MAHMRCALCHESKEPGWLCAEHPDLPWEHDGCRAEAMRCACNPAGEVVFEQVFADNRKPELQQ